MVNDRVKHLIISDEVSYFIHNVPMFSSTMGMYYSTGFGTDNKLWHVLIFALELEFPPFSLHQPVMFCSWDVKIFISCVIK